MVSTASIEDLCRTVLTWLDQHCSLTELRPCKLQMSTGVWNTVNLFNVTRYTILILTWCSFSSSLQRRSTHWRQSAPKLPFSPIHPKCQNRLRPQWWNPTIHSRRETASGCSSSSSRMSLQNFVWMCRNSCFETVYIAHHVPENGSCFSQPYHVPKRATNQRDIFG